MARTAWPTVLSGDSWSASQHNTYGRDNDLAYWVYTTAGDMAYATASNALARLAIGATYRVLKVAGGLPTWATLLEKCVLYKTSNQSFNTGVSADITFDSESVDDAGWHSTVSNTERITVLATGFYLPFACVRFVKNTGGSGVFQTQAYIRRNGSVETGNQSRLNWDIDANPKTFMLGGIATPLTAGDYISLNFNQDSGGSGNITGAVGETMLALYRLT